MPSTITDWEQALARHAIAHALEGDVAIHASDQALDDMPYDPSRWSIEHFDKGMSDDGDQYAHVGATYETVVSGRKTGSRTRTHPAEYATHDATLCLDVKYWPSRNGGFGEAEASIEQEGGAPDPQGPPANYDPYEL